MAEAYGYKINGKKNMLKSGEKYAATEMIMERKLYFYILQSCRAVRLKDLYSSRRRLPLVIFLVISGAFEYCHVKHFSISHKH